MMMLTGQLWASTHRCDRHAMAMYLRHYSSRKRRAGSAVRQFIGPGSTLVLVRDDAAFVWRKFIDDCALGGGVNCAMFRNEGDQLSSALIAEACEWAWAKWPGERLYTYVDANRIRSSNPGCCFKAAGWRGCGNTRGGLHVREVCGGRDS